jgi:hypothetical protein
VYLVVTLPAYLVRDDVPDYIPTEEDMNGWTTAMKASVAK